MCSSENPRLSYEGSSAEVLVEAVDQGNLLMMMIVMIMMMMVMMMMVKIGNLKDTVINDFEGIDGGGNIYQW